MVQQTSSGHLIFSKQAFDQILQDRNHSSYLGEAGTPAWAAHEGPPTTLARVESGPVQSWACHLLTMFITQCSCSLSANQAFAVTAKETYIVPANPFLLSKWLLFL